MNPDPNVESHISALREFVREAIGDEQLAGPSVIFEPLSGDAGFRRYFRVNTCLPMLAVYAPPATENSVQFAKVAACLMGCGVRVPRIVAMDADRGFLLVEDFGDCLLQNELSKESVDGFYSEAMSMLLHLHSAALAGEQLDFLPQYDAAMLLEELALFERWFLNELLGLELSESQSEMLRTLFDSLIKSALEQPQVIVHRDFHSRNLLVLPTGALATIDFQDAVRGPISYDLVSLLKDCYVVWPSDQVERWALAYAKTLDAAGVAAFSSEQAFLKSFHLMGMQRHIKVLGIFARLYLRDNKPGYLGDLPRVLTYVLEVVESHNELVDFAQFLRQTVKPALSKRLRDIGVSV